ncbi:MAG: amidohydrolase family protein [Clostridia bacterium]|nr:amidohydrolase family protein [Clostridia bacterium]
MYDSAILNGKCYIDHQIIETNIYMKNGKTALVDKAVFPASKIIDATGLTVYPGFIDPHVHLHLNIGKSFSADDFQSGTELAALGGVTTVLDFLDPIWSNTELDEVFDRRMNEASCALVDYSFHCTLGHYNDDVEILKNKVLDKGITSVKVFTTYSDSNRRCDYAVIEKLLGQPILVMTHGEEDQLITQPKSISEYETSRSEEAELMAIKTLIKLANQQNGKLYIVHISSGHTLNYLNEGRLNPRIYLESCPQYFYLNKDLFLKEDGRLYLLAPPLRGDDSILLMKKHFNLLNTIGTDHCPFTYKEKMNALDIIKIPKGIGSLGLTFPLMYELFGLDIIPKITSEPASIFNLNNKGSIKVGNDADYAIVNHNAITVCSEIRRNMDYELYHETLHSKVEMTILRGNIIMAHDEIFESKGQYIRRNYESNY